MHNSCCWRFAGHANIRGPVASESVTQTVMVPSLLSRSRERRWRCRHRRAAPARAGEPGAPGPRLARWLKGEPERAAPARARHAQITQITQFYTDYVNKLELRRNTQKSYFLQLWRGVTFRVMMRNFGQFLRKVWISKILRNRFFTQ